LDEAERAFRRACDLAPDSPNGYVGLALVARGRGACDRATELLNKALALEPWNVQALYDLGGVFADQERYHEAEGQYRKVLTTQPDHLAARRGLAAIATHYGRLGEARTLWEQVIEAEPGDRAARYHLGEICLWLELFGEALEQFDAVRVLEPKSAGVWNNLGLAYQGKDDSARALQSFQQAYELAPRNWKIINNLADLHLLLHVRDPSETGHLKEAVLLWKQSIGINPNQKGRAELKVLIRRSEAELGRKPSG